MKKNAPSFAEPFPYRDFQEALKRLKAAILRGPGYTLLLGESGTGKTTLLRTLAPTLDHRRFHVLYFCHAQPSPTGLTRVIAETLHLPIRGSRAETGRLLVQALRDFPTRLVLWADEAQLMREDTLHELRLLAEAAFDGPPLFSVVLSGLPQLKERLLVPQLFPLWRRIAPRVTLTGLIREEVGPFLAHAFSKEAVVRFSPDSLSALFEQGRGVPALLHSYAGECLRLCPQGSVSADVVAEAIDQLEAN